MSNQQRPDTRRSRSGVRLVGTIGLLGMLVTSCSQGPSYDLVIRNGTLYDGSGSPPRVANLAVNGDTIAAIGDLSATTGRQEMDARGLAVAPGFVNMLSWANESLIRLAAA